MASAIVISIVGLLLLLAGAELLVRGAVKTAELLRAPAILVGLTLVAWGTSAPELAVSIKAALAGQPEIAVGNVVGSNLFNLLVVLGIGALILPLAVERMFVKRDIPALIAVSLLTWFLLLDGTLSRVDAAILLIGWVAYTYVLFLYARRTRTVDDLIQQEQPEAVTGKAVTAAAVSVAAGLAALTIGSNWFVDGAVEIAQWARVSERVIGLTLVAAGTSLPELAASIVAVIRKQRDLAVGNIVGSNMFNLLTILGVTGAAQRTMQVNTQIIYLDMPVMIAATLIVLPLAFTRWKITRVEGAILFLLYITYMVALIAGWLTF